MKIKLSQPEQNLLESNYNKETESNYQKIIKLFVKKVGLVVFENKKNFLRQKLHDRNQICFKILYLIVK